MPFQRNVPQGYHLLSIVQYIVHMSVMLREEMPTSYLYAKNPVPKICSHPIYPPCPTPVHITNSLECIPFLSFFSRSSGPFPFLNKYPMTHASMGQSHQTILAMAAQTCLYLTGDYPPVNNLANAVFFASNSLIQPSALSMSALIAPFVVNLNLCYSPRSSRTSTADTHMFASLVVSASRGVALSDPVAFILGRVVPRFAFKKGRLESLQRFRERPFQVRAHCCKQKTNVELWSL